MDYAGRIRKVSSVSIITSDSSRSTSTSSLGDRDAYYTGPRLRHIPSEGLLAMIRREESVSAEGVGFQSKYEPKEILGR